MLKVLFVLALAVTCLTSPPVFADNVDLALEAFHGTCLAHGPDFERTAAAAEKLGWAPLSGDDFPTVGRVDAIQGWVATGNDMPAKTKIAVAKVTLNGKSVQTCSVRLYGIDRAVFEKRLFSRTDAEKIGEERNATQVSKLYILTAGNRKQLIHLTWPRSRITSNMIIASSIADE